MTKDLGPSSAYAECFEEGRLIKVLGKYENDLCRDSAHDIVDLPVGRQRAHYGDIIEEW